MTRNAKMLSLMLLGSILGTPAAQAQESGLASYEATYRLTLGAIDYKGAVITAKGAMAMRVRRDCQRWQSHSEFLFLLELDSGDKVRTHTMFRQRESLDGQNIDFVYWQDLSGSGRLEYSGNATIPSGGEAGTVKYEKPKRIERKLPKGVEMPITAMREIVQSLITDGTTAKHNYFDPQAKFVEIRSVGGDPIILAIPPKGDASLVDGRSWRLRATPIPEGRDEEENKDAELKEEEQENYTMIQIHDSGVASFMEMKSGITTIHAELTDVKQLPPPNCNRPKPPELELSKDCGEPKAARKEEVAEGDEPRNKPVTEEELAAVSVEDAKEVADCETVAVDKGANVEEVEAAPVGEVELEFTGEAGMPADESMEEQTANESGEQPVEEQPAEEQPAEEQPAEEQPAEEQPTEEQPTEEAQNDGEAPEVELPSITEASATN